MDVPRETEDRLVRLERLIRTEASRQNLVASSTLDDFHDRHILDSLQLIPLLAEGAIIDVGSGAGLPGLVIASTLPEKILLVEPRRRRADFLEHTIAELELRNARVARMKVERLEHPPVATITARAVMSLDALFAATGHLATPATRWVLPKGRSAQSELATAQLSWQGQFELVRSRTDPDAFIVVAENVRKREG